MPQSARLPQIRPTEARANQHPARRAMGNTIQLAVDQRAVPAVRQDSTPTLKGRTMNSIFRQGLLVSLCVVTSTLTLAQTPPSGVGPGSAASASGPARGADGRMQGWHMNKGNTPGWSMMNPAERSEHHQRMMGMKSYEACRAYMDQHHAAMVERAKNQGRTPPAHAQHDPCLRLKD